MRLVDGIARFTTRHERVLGIIGILALALSTAVYARFIRLPELDLISERSLMWLSVAYNAIWWGYLRPRVEQRKRSLASSGNAEAAHG